MKFNINEIIVIASASIVKSENTFKWDTVQCKHLIHTSMLGVAKI